MFLEKMFDTTKTLLSKRTKSFGLNLTKKTKKFFLTETRKKQA